jgi:hypothetical protein
MIELMFFVNKTKIYLVGGFGQQTADASNNFTGPDRLFLPRIIIDFSHIHYKWISIFCFK